MTYKELWKMTEGKEFPLWGLTNENEPTVIDRGRTDNGHFFRLTIVQDNDWLRIVTLWEDGTTEETFKK